MWVCSIDFNCKLLQLFSELKARYKVFKLYWKVIKNSEKGIKINLHIAAYPL